MNAIRYILGLLLMLYGTVSVTAQVLNQDAEGNSTIFWDGGNVGLDITKTEAALTYNRIWSKDTLEVLETTPSFLFGITAKSKNETGIAGLFNNGKFVPGGSVSMRFGGVKLCSPENPFKEQIDSVKAVSDSTKVEAEKIELAKKIDSLKIELRAFESRTTYKKITWFIDGGFTASGFNLREETGAVNTWGNFIKKENFFGPYLQLVVNYQTGGWIQGFSVKYAKVNNLDDLSSEKFTYRTVDSLQEGVITREATKETYKRSEFKVFDRVSLNYDLIDVIALPAHRGKPQGFMAFNILYLRYGMSNASGNFRLGLKENNMLTMGTGLHFFDFKGKFLGGVYGQLNDVTNWEDDTKFSDKASFGIFTRFNIQAMGMDF